MSRNSYRICEAIALELKKTVANFMDHSIMSSTIWLPLNVFGRGSACPLRQIITDWLRRVVVRVVIAFLVAYIRRICINLSSSCTYHWPCVAKNILDASSRTYAFRPDVLQMLDNASSIKGMFVET